ncbi:MAG: hypothetical protein CMJ95_11085 [Planctomycetes bacterium]|nr:hypothetical protein [Planctomycetota bacterium]
MAIRDRTDSGIDDGPIELSGTIEKPSGIAPGFGEEPVMSVGKSFITPLWSKLAMITLVSGLMQCSSFLHAQTGGPGEVLDPLGPMPAPPENPLTEEKALLGKFLFWEEQLSHDNSTSCGSCHMPEVGGSDARADNPRSIHPGFDGLFGTPDDISGSIGVVLQDCSGGLLDDGVFYPERQVTSRRSQSMIGAGYHPTLFWDGRAGPEFTDPESGQVLIATGGALEAQAVAPIVSMVEMSCDTQSWDNVRQKLISVTPLALATDLPGDIEDALALFPDYPSLFENAFGDDQINATRIAYAIASYERILIPDRTPFDLFNEGNAGVLTANQQQGMLLFIDNCVVCHSTPALGDGEFRNIGVRPIFEDEGHFLATGDPDDMGLFKTPSLRNAGLRAPYFHNGGKADLDEVLAFYNGGGDFEPNDPLMDPMQLGNSELAQIKDFIINGLTDSRVEFGLPPFDHPTMQPFFVRGDSNDDGAVDISDAIHALEFLFTGGEVICEDATDINDDGALDIADPIALLARLFGGSAPLPLPSDISFGPDPTADGLVCLR